MVVPVHETAQSVWNPTRSTHHRWRSSMSCNEITCAVFQVSSPEFRFLCQRECASKLLPPTATQMCTWTQLQSRKMSEAFTYSDLVWAFCALRDESEVVSSDIIGFQADRDQSFRHLPACQFSRNHLCGTWQICQSPVGMCVVGWAFYEGCFAALCVRFAELNDSVLKSFLSCNHSCSVVPEGFFPFSTLSMPDRRREENLILTHKRTEERNEVSKKRNKAGNNCDPNRGLVRLRRNPLWTG